MFSFPKVNFSITKVNFLPPSTQARKDVESKESETKRRKAGQYVHQKTNIGRVMEKIALITVLIKVITPNNEKADTNLIISRLITKRLK